MRSCFLRKNGGQRRPSAAIFPQIAAPQTSLSHYNTKYQITRNSRITWIHWTKMVTFVLWISALWAANWSCDIQECPLCLQISGSLTLCTTMTKMNNRFFIYMGHIMKTKYLFYIWGLFNNHSVSILLLSYPLININLHVKYSSNLITTFWVKIQTMIFHFPGEALFNQTRPILLPICPLNHSGGRRSPAVACWASDHWVTSTNLLRGKFRH